MSTYTPISSITLASAASSVTFSGIPQTYTDLVLVTNFGVSSSVNTWMRLNGDTGSNYSITGMYGTGTSAVSTRRTNDSAGIILDYFGTTGGTNRDGSTIIHLQNYTNTTTNKTVLVRSSNTSETVAIAGLWRNTSAINSVTLRTTASETFNSGSTFNLYGIANASLDNVAKATGGDSVYTDGTYWYHIFRSSGTFRPTQALTADYLVVAGGGGASNSDIGGAGGAGGMRCTVGATGGGGSLESALSLTAQAYTVTVGAGGSGTSTPGTNGSNSVFATITSTGGGYGGARTGSFMTGAAGGSGGGGGTDGSPTGGSISGGTASPSGQGYNGGNGISGPTSAAGGGGGGAGAAGSNATLNNPGAGGNGATTSISGTSTTYAGGGGGGSGYTSSTSGTGGTGGGGNGARSGVAPQSGTANTGGGGGGGGIASTYNGGNGGSGIVIIRYSAA